jgi:molybdopterin-binding protein
MPNTDRHERKQAMKIGAQDQVTGRVVSIQRGDVMSLIKFEVTTPAQMASVITTESVGELTIGRISGLSWIT